MPQDDDLIYRKGLGKERIEEIQKETKACRYKENCTTAAIVGTGIAIAAAMLLGISFGIIYFLVAGLGAAVGYAFYA